MLVILASTSHWLIYAIYGNMFNVVRMSLGKAPVRYLVAVVCNQVHALCTPNGFPTGFPLWLSVDTRQMRH